MRFSQQCQKRSEEDGGTHRCRYSTESGTQSQERGVSALHTFNLFLWGLSLGIASESYSHLGFWASNNPTEFGNEKKNGKGGKFGRLQVFYNMFRGRTALHITWHWRFECGVCGNCVFIVQRICQLRVGCNFGDLGRLGVLCKFDGVGPRGALSTPGVNSEGWARRRVVMKASFRT